MQRLTLILLCLTLSFAQLWAKSKVKEAETYNYEIEAYSANSTVDASKCIIRVWSYGKKENATRDICMRNAVHGILFKGYAAFDFHSSGKQALVPDGYDAHKEYFDQFFNSGDYKQFVQVTNKGMAEAGSVIKISKNEYKIGVVVMISYDALRKRLENDGIIKKMDFLF